MDASGELVQMLAAGTAYRNALELVQLLADAPETSACMVKRAYRFVHGRHENSHDNCGLYLATYCQHGLAPRSSRGYRSS